LVRYVKSPPQRLERFKPCANRQKIACYSSLILNIPTNWNLTYTMLEVTEKYKRALDLLQEKDGPLMTYLNQIIG
jgi:hypothetical protein